MRVLSEAFNRLRLNTFFSELKDFDMEHIQNLVREFSEEISKQSNEDLIKEKWDLAKMFVEVNLSNNFHTFVKADKISDKFKYWNLFLDVFMPIVMDLTRSFREADWNLHLSAVRRSLPLFFAFGRTNYCRWTPLYYEDCINLENKFPLLQTAFLKGDFVVHQTLRKCSAVPIDQALEMASERSWWGYWLHTEKRKCC